MLEKSWKKILLVIFIVACITMICFKLTGNIPLMDQIKQATNSMQKEK